MSNPEVGGERISSNEARVMLGLTYEQFRRLVGLQTFTIVRFQGGRRQFYKNEIQSFLERSTQRPAMAV